MIARLTSFASGTLFDGGFMNQILMRATALVVLACVASGCAGSSAAPQIPSSQESLGSPTTLEPTGVDDPIPSAETESSDSNEVFYLAADLGCYSYGRDPSQPWFIDAIDKVLYAQTCQGPHNAEVIYAGSLPGFTAQRNLTQSDAEESCSTAYREVFGVEPPTAEIDPVQQKETPYLVWSFPDDGLEAQKFPGRLVCLVVVTTPDFAKADSITGALSSADA